MFNEKVHVMDHPLVAHKLTIMRDKNTSVKDFRELVSEIGMLITYEATRDLPLTDKEIETPICKTTMPTLAGKKFAVVPILRAGLGLVEGVLRMVPSARVGHIGMFRDEETLQPHVYRRSHAGHRRQRRGGHHRDEEARLQEHQADGAGGSTRGHPRRAGRP